MTENGAEQEDTYMNCLGTEMVKSGTIRLASVVMKNIAKLEKTIPLWKLPNSNLGLVTRYSRYPEALIIYCSHCISAPYRTL